MADKGDFYGSGNPGTPATGGNLAGTGGSSIWPGAGLLGIPGVPTFFPMAGTNGGGRWRRLCLQ